MRKLWNIIKALVIAAIVILFLVAGMYAIAILIPVIVGLGIFVIVAVGLYGAMQESDADS